MRNLRAPLSLLFLWLGLGCVQAAPPEPPALVVESRGEDFEFVLTNGLIMLSNNVIVTYGDSVLTANSATINTNSGDVFAEGSVRVQKDDLTWTGAHLHYNYLNGRLDGEQFRAGKSPFFASGEGLQGDITNHAYSANAYSATNAFVTADDYSQPLLKVRAKYLKIVPGQYFEARDATVWLGDVPVFYFPYYRRGLAEHEGHFNFVPGFRSSFGPFLLGSYDWYLDQYLQGAFHADWREKRGFGGGPDFNLHLGEFGEGTVKYYYTHDHDTAEDNSPTPLPENRQRVAFSWDANPVTNLTVKSAVAWWSDPLITHDFFESEYRKNIEPKTYFDVNKLSQNWSLDLLAQPRVNGFFETVERLPDVQLTGYRQEILDTPLYYDSQSSAGWYRRLFSDTNTVPEASYSASRADTYHQITLPETFFGWLNLTPRAGGRFTWYSEAEGPGATTTEHYRTVFNTGAELSTKASRLWSGAQSDLFDVSGLRHIVEPSINYVYVPSPNILPTRLPQFDYELTNNYYLLPIEFPDYNAIDSIDSQNVIRWGLRNRLQTKRDGQLDDLLDSQIYLDWRLKPRTGQTTFSDIYSDLSLKPRSWLTLESQTMFNIQDGNFDLARHQLTFRPNDVWSWSVGHYFLRGGSLFGTGEDQITSSFFYRFNDNWGARMSHNFSATDGKMQEMYYTIYRDLRSWTAALTFRVRDNVNTGRDYTVALSISLKAFPHFALGDDTVDPSSLVGY